MQGCRLDGDVGNNGGIWREAAAERVKIGQSAGIELGLNDLGEFGLASPIMRERQQPDHGAAGRLFAVMGQQRLEGTPVGATREELLAVDEI